MIYSYQWQKIGIMLKIRSVWKASELHYHAIEFLSQRLERRRVRRENVVFICSSHQHTLSIHLKTISLSQSHKTLRSLRLCVSAIKKELYLLYASVSKLNHHVFVIAVHNIPNLTRFGQAAWCAQSCVERGRYKIIKCPVKFIKDKIYTYPFRQILSSDIMET